MKNLIKEIQEKIKSLKLELDSITYTSNRLNLKITDFEEKRMLELRSKIQVLNEIIISYAVNETKEDNL